MNNYVIILIGVIIAIIIVGSTVAYMSMNDSDDVQNPISNITAVNATSNVSTSNNSSEPYVVSEEIVFNAQAGKGYFREVTYSDGNFRQYDIDTGKLIGSSYSSDQDQLPSVE